MISFSFNLDKINKEMNLNNKNSLEINFMVDLQEQQESYLKKIESLDKITNKQEMAVQLRSLMNHKYIQAAMRYF